jgi:hypothetical protein
MPDLEERGKKRSWPNIWRAPDTGSLCHLTSIVSHFLPLLCRACGRLDDLATLIRLKFRKELANDSYGIK